MKTEKEIIKDYFKERNAKAGRASAQSPIRTKEYYSNLGKKSAEKRRKQKENTPSAIIQNILTGRI